MLFADGTFILDGHIRPLGTHSGDLGSERLPGDIRETFDANNDYGLIPHHQRFHTTLSDHK